MLISVHMPKTAGLSFRASLEAHFGDRFRHDYQDYPLAQPVAVRREQAQQAGLAARAAVFEGIDCVHGHFLPLKYLQLAKTLPCTFVTWLREPVARLVSHYYYWQRAYDPASGLTSALHRRVIEEKWSLEQFCLAPQLRNVYSEFLWGFPPERLDFIGITEFFEEDLRYFSQNILGNNMQPQTLNRGGLCGSGGSAASVCAADRVQIEAVHMLDVELYRFAVGLRGYRLAGRA